jgi:hypothetical protein
VASGDPAGVDGLPQLFTVRIRRAEQGKGGEVQAAKHLYVVLCTVPSVQYSTTTVVQYRGTVDGVVRSTQQPLPQQCAKASTPEARLYWTGTVPEYRYYVLLVLRKQ